MRRKKIILLVLGFIGSLFLANIALTEEETQEYRDLLRIINSMVGYWEGTSQYYDRETGELKSARSVHTIAKGPMSYVFSIHGLTHFEDGRVNETYEVMGVRYDGGVIRQLNLHDKSATFKEEIVLGYNIKSDNDWTMRFLEVREGVKGQAGPGLLTVSFKFSGDTFTIEKTQDYGVSSSHDFELAATMYRKPENGESQ